MIKRLLILVGMLASAVHSNGQDAPASTPIFGTVAGNQAAGSGSSPGSSLYNVNLYTGTASMNIPIYSYSIAGLDLGVSIGYDARGVKVDQVASSVGLGWNINAGGSITRKIYGVEDELCYADDLFTGAWMMPGNNHDKEYDEFTANFAGRTIRFAMRFDNDKMVFTTYPHSEIKINMFYQDGNAGLAIYPFSRMYRGLDKVLDVDPLKFEIVDELDNHFYFEQGNTSERHYNDSSLYYRPENWNLVKIITHSGDVVKYNYWQADVSYPEYKDEQVYEVRNGFTWNSTGQNMTAGITCKANKAAYYKGRMTDIESIEYPNGVKVSFDGDNTNRWDIALNAELHPVKSIRITQGIDNQLKNVLTYRFNYAYFHAAFGGDNTPELPFATNTSQEIDNLVNRFRVPGISEDSVIYEIKTGLRLKLKSIERVGTDGTTVEPYYSFDYNAMQLPRRLSPSRDFYGFYNGQLPVLTSSNPAYPYELLRNSSVNKHTATMNGYQVTYGTDKTPNLTYMKAAVLEKITNAGGGTIEFLYKDHQLANPEDAYIGSTYFGNTKPEIRKPADAEGVDANDGLCIDKIVIKDGVNEDNTITEEYVFEDGQRFFAGGFTWYSTHYATMPVPDDRIYLTSFATPMQTIDGSNHGYSVAEVKKYGYNNQFLGSTRHHFTNLMWTDKHLMTRSNLGHYLLDPVYNSQTNKSELVFDYNYNTFPLTMYQFRMGKPLNIRTFDINHNVSASTSYRYIDSSEYTVRGDYNSPINRAFLGYNLSNYYSFVATPYLLDTKTDSVFTATGNFVTTTNYTYTPDFRINTETTVDQLGNPVSLQYMYTDFYATMSNVYHLSQQPNTASYRSVIPVGVAKNKRVNNVAYSLSGQRMIIQTFADNRYRPAKNLQLITESPVPIADYFANEQMVNEVTKYDEHNNITEVKYEDREIYTCAIWDTRLGEKIASVRNARHEEIAYTSFEGTTYKDYHVADENKGNWDFKPDGVLYVPGISVSGAMTGKYFYGLNWSNPIDAVNPTVSGKQYTLTFWATDAPYVNAGGDFYNLTQQTQVGNWKLYTATFTGNGSALRIWTNSAVDMDELRLYPSDATMATTTYEPLFGPSSSCDERNNIIYQEYDAMGRPSATWDINRKLRSLTETVVGGSNNN